MVSGDCIFCGILAGHVDASFIYRDDDCAAFMDIQPVNPGHVLVIPTNQEADLAGLGPDEWAQIAVLGQRIAAALRESDIRCEAVNMFLADGEAAGQEVFHAHLHVFPRFDGDGFGLKFPAGYLDLPSRSTLDAQATELRDALE